MSKRAIGRVAILMPLVFGFVPQPLWATDATVASSPGVQTPPTSNSISGFKVRQDKNGRWMVDFDYFYTGTPRGAYIAVGLSGSKIPAELRPYIENSPGMLPGPDPDRGSHHVSVTLERPLVPVRFTTSQVWIEMRGMVSETGKTAGSLKTLARQEVNQVINWPDMDTWNFYRQFAEKTTEEILNISISQIDSGNEDLLARAKRTLETLVTREPNCDAAYVELARIAMKSNWGPEGLHQAETLLQSALQIQPHSVNAKILLGYVYANQKRYKLAENLFKDAASSNPRNVWLWTNWGQALVMQGKIDQGIEKYREAISKPPTNDTYDNARLAAYEQLIILLGKRNDRDGQEALYKQRAEEFAPANDCYFSDYAQFILQQRGNAAQAIALALKAVDGNCPTPEARESLGLAHYAAWAAAPADQRPKLLNQARVFLPMGPRPIYLLASNEHTAATVRQLKDAGESIDQYDNDRLNALAYAVQSRDYSTATRLIRLGARPEALVGLAQFPVALLPVIERDLDGIRLMRKFGVDYSKLQYKGKSVLDQVRQLGDRELINALSPKKSII